MSGLRGGAVRANRTHMTRLASGNWSRKKNTFPVLTTTAACTVMTRAEIVTRPGTVPVATLRAPRAQPHEGGRRDHRRVPPGELLAGDVTDAGQPHRFGEVPDHRPHQTARARQLKVLSHGEENSCSGCGEPAYPVRVSEVH